MSGQPGTAPDLSELWLEELGQLTGHALHALRNGLQGVAVNLEVIRSRVERTAATSDSAESGATVTSSPDLRTFAANASRQFEDVSLRIESLAFLCRQPSGEPELSDILNALAALVRTRDRQPLTVLGDSGDSRVAADPVAVRLLLTRLTLPAVKSGALVRCEVKIGSFVSVDLLYEPENAGGPRPDDIAIANAAHISMKERPGGWTLTFPSTLRSDTVLV